MTRTRLHPAWIVAAVTAGALLAASAFRSTTGVLIEPIVASTGWSLDAVTGAASVNLIVYGLATPFAAAAMQAWGARRTVVASLGITALASAATMAASAPWQLWLLWGLFIGVGTGALALTFGAIVANRWFVARRDLVTGVFSAASAAGQVLFVPLVAHVAAGPGWRAAALVTALAALVMGVACLLWLRDWPAERGVRAYGAPPVGAAGVGPASSTAETEDDVVPGASRSPVRETVRVLRGAVGRWPFWVLMLSFAVCGWTTNGLVVTHLVPAAHDHAMPTTMAASLIAVIGVFDVVGTVISGWLTERFDPRILLTLYYATRGASLLVVQSTLGPDVSVPLWAWIVFYGLDWTATVPPTVALCREVFGLHDSGLAFGWVYAAHMVGAGIGAHVSGLLRTGQGDYTSAWLVAAALCAVAAVLPLTLRRSPACVAG